jgi:hypothetical protein
MSGLAINGVSTGGQVYELKSNIDKTAALQAAKKDGLDNVFFEAEGKNFMVSGQNLDLSGLKSDKNQVSVEVNGKSFLVRENSVDMQNALKGKVPTNPTASIQFSDHESNAKITAVDNEINSAKEGVKNVVGGAIGAGAGIGVVVTGAGIVAGGLGSFISGAASIFLRTTYKSEPIVNPAVRAGIIAGVVIAGATIGGAAIYGAAKGTHPEVMDNFIKK